MSIFDGAGYFMNDDRASGGKLAEDDILACAHQSPGCANAAMRKSEWKLKGGMCMACCRPLCFPCYQRTVKLGCDGPEVKRIEEAVNAAYRRSQNAKILGV